MAGASGWNEVVWPEADEVDLAAASVALPAAGSYIVRFVLMMGKTEDGSSLHLHQSWKGCEILAVKRFDSFADCWRRITASRGRSRWRET